MKIKIVALSLVSSLFMTGCAIIDVPEKITAVGTEMTQTLQDTRESFEEARETFDQVSDMLTDLATSPKQTKELREKELADAKASLSKDATDETYEPATFVRVVDGDTLIVTMDGEEQRIRLIGVNTPESVASEEYLAKTGKENTEEGKNASEYVKGLLTEGQTLYLEADSKDEDAYGRLLRYVWLSIPEDKSDPQEVSETMLNGLLVWEGYAEAVAYAPNTAYMQIFEYLEDYTKF